MCIVVGFGTWIIERGMFMCIVLGRTKNIHVHCAWFGHMDYRTRYIHVYMCIVLVSAHGIKNVVFSCVSVSF